MAEQRCKRIVVAGACGSDQAVVILVTTAYSVPTPPTHVSVRPISVPARRRVRPCLDRPSLDGGRVSTGRVSTGRVSTGRVSTGRVSTGRVSTGRVSTGRVSTGRVSTGRVSTGRVSTGRVSTGRVSTATESIDDRRLPIGEGHAVGAGSSDDLTGTIGGDHRVDRTGGRRRHLDHRTTSGRAPGTRRPVRGPHRRPNATT